MDNNRKKKIATVAAICVAAGIIGTVLMGMMPGGGPGGGVGGGPGGMSGGSGSRSGGSEEADQAASKTVVETETPALGSIAVTGSFVGTVEPGRQVTVYPKASGKVLEANYKTGDTVEAGAVLFRLDSTSLELDIAQSQANLRIAKAKAELNLETAQQNLENYESNIDGGLNSSILQAEASVKSAEVALQQATVDFRTARQNHIDYLNDDWDGDYSESTLTSLRNARTQAELKVESAQLSLENAKANLKAVKNQVGEQKTSAETGVKTAELNTDFSAEQISLQKLQNNLADYTVTAPISGVIEVKSIDAYDTVSTQTASYVISNKELLSVSFGVAESALSYLHIGDTVTLEKNGETFPGTVSEVATMVDSASGLYIVKADVGNPPFELRSGSTVKLRAETQKEENVMLVPIDAVYYDNGNPYVFVFEDNAARRAEVEVGISDDTRIHVKSGLSMSDQVIVTWSASLYDGAEVYLPGTAPRESAGETDAAPEGAEPPTEGEAAEGRQRPDAAPRGEAEGRQAPGSSEAATGESGDEASSHTGEEATP